MRPGLERLLAFIGTGNLIHTGVTANARQLEADAAHPTAEELRHRRYGMAIVNDLCAATREVILSAESEETSSRVGSSPLAPPPLSCMSS
jgi:hypothetical protein